MMLDNHSYRNTSVITLIVNIDSLQKNGLVEKWTNMPHMYFEGQNSGSNHNVMNL